MSNRLAQEDSPYLQQHKENPVDWWPWCDEAFQTAKRQNKAIFISIGYSSCHWCHVMEESVFENKECAEILNAGFISIKVDREERPDIDKHFQEVHLLLNRRSGGWPTSIFCTPQNKPFFAGTYIPPESSSGSMEGMGFKELTKLITLKVQEHDPKLFQNAEEIEGFINQVTHPKEATNLKEEFYKNFLLQAKNNFDTKNGGFSVAPKFPHASTLNALLHIERLYSEKSVAPMIKTTLNSMIQGGLYDLVDGGFCRYSVDEKWLVPHFEKMLYDNALLCGVYSDAYLTYRDESYLKTAKECAEFWYKFMCEDNLFYSASDADSEGAEGSYFLYTYEEVYSALESEGYSNIASICEALSLTPHGNFEGKNIIRHTQKGVPENFDDIRSILSQIRAQRSYPFIDKKVQTSWSSMMITALFKLGAIEQEYRLRAINHLDALLEKMFVDDRLYHTALVHKAPKIEAFLEDYAFLAQALLAAFKATQDESYLINAQRFANRALEKFYKRGTWSFSVGEFTTQAEISDNTYTSSIAIIVDVLLTLGSLLDDDKYTHFAFKTLEYNSYELGRKTIYFPYLLIDTLHYIKGERIIKASKESLEQNRVALAELEYPFVSLREERVDGFMICAQNRCFANTMEIKEINSVIANSF